MAYQSEDANKVKRALEGMLLAGLPVGSQREHTIREALEAFDRIVSIYLPEGELNRRLWKR
jgi:hypothetical protein